MGGIYLTNENDAKRYVDGFKGDAEEAMIEVFEYAGEFFKGHARENRKFNDITGNLKASIGYSVALDGSITKDGTNGNAAEGQSEAKQGIKELIRDNNRGLVLVGLAGMHYGPYVENMKGKRVISQSINPTYRLLTRMLDELTG